MANISRALKKDLAALLPPPQFTPPYVYAMRYDRETRSRLEAPNRATVAAIFKRRATERQTLAWARKVLAMHNAGAHMPGRCPHCPANIYYD